MLPHIEFAYDENVFHLAYQYMQQPYDDEKPKSNVKTDEKAASVSTAADDAGKTQQTQETQDDGKAEMPQ